MTRNMGSLDRGVRASLGALVAIAFASIWIALALYVVALLHAARLPQPTEYC